MRVAAGVLLIIAAVINLFASLGYLGCGAATTGLSSVSESVIEASLIEDGAMTQEEAREAAELTNNMKGAGGMLMGMGVFLLVSVGILIAGAVFLFQAKRLNSRWGPVLWRSLRRGLALPSSRLAS